MVLKYLIKNQLSTIKSHYSVCVCVTHNETWFEVKSAADQSRTAHTNLSSMHAKDHIVMENEIWKSK